MEKLQNCWIIIPAYKPSAMLQALTAALLQQGFEKILIVNDGSGAAFDNCFASLPQCITLLTHKENCGKGAALKTAFSYLLTQKYTDCSVITCDADGQHRPEDIRALAALLPMHPDAVVLGSRALQGRIPLRSAFGNALTRRMFRLASGIALQDTQTGLRGFSGTLLPLFLDIPGARYEYETNVLLTLTRAGISITELPIATVYEKGNPSSHFHVLRDSFRIYASILKFSCVSLLCFFLDCAVLFLCRQLTGFLSPGVSLLVSVLLARLVSSAANYLLNRHLVFQRGNRLSALKYYLLVLGMLVANYGLLSLLNLQFGLPLSASKLLTESTLYLLSYQLQKRFIFPKSKSVTKEVSP